MKGFRRFAYASIRVAILVLRRHYGIREADGCSRTPPGAMLRRPFRYRRSFMYVDMSAVRYIAESVASWEKESGSVAKLWASNIRFGYCAILTVTLVWLARPSHLIAEALRAGKGRSRGSNDWFTPILNQSDATGRNSCQ